MWQACIGLALLAGNAGGVDSAQVSNAVRQQAETAAAGLPQVAHGAGERPRDGTGERAGGGRVGREDGREGGRAGARIGLRIRSAARRLAGREQAAYGGLRVGRGWSRRPDSTTSWTFGVRGPRVWAGFRPEVALARRFVRVAASGGAHPRPARREPRDRWTLGVSRPEAGGSIVLDRARGGLRRWNVHLGRSTASPGRMRLSRTSGSAPSTAISWLRNRGGRMTLTAGLRPREGRVRLRTARGRSAFDLMLASTGARNSTRARRGRRSRAGTASTGRIRAALRRGPLQLGAASTFRGDSAGVELMAARGFRAPGGRCRLQVAAQLALAQLGGPGPGSAQAGAGTGAATPVALRAVRAHLSYTPRARWGPLGVALGAGVRYRPAAGRVAGALRPDVSAALSVHGRAVSARLGWEMSLLSGTMRLEPALACGLEATPGPWLLSARARPSTRGLRWSAALGWRRNPTGS